MTGMWRNEYAQDMCCVLRSLGMSGECVCACVSETLGCCKPRYRNAIPPTR